MSLPLQHITHAAVVPPPNPDDFWHPSIEKVPEFLDIYLRSEEMKETHVHHIEVCLSLRNEGDTSKPLHWCLLFTNNHRHQITIDRRYLDHPILIEEPNEALIIDPCSGLGRKSQKFIHSLNSDELAERRLTLRTIAIFNLNLNNTVPQATYSGLFICVSRHSKREYLCCSVTRLGQAEHLIVESTRMWAVTMLQAFFIPKETEHMEMEQLMAGAIARVDVEMQAISCLELDAIIRAGNQ